MFRNYLKVALRNIKKHKGYSLINISGLSVGMACCLVIFLYIASELTYDQYHEDADRIYRVAMYWKVPSGEFQSAGVSAGVAPGLNDRFTQVECAARIMPIHDMLVKNGNIRFYEDRMVYADQELFNIFKIPFINGNPAKALERPWTVVITRRIAEKYFGIENPLGKTIEIKEGAARMVRSMSKPDSDNTEYEITGVVENPPSNTHFKYDFIVSQKQLKQNVLRDSWHGGGVYTYVKLAPNVSAKDFEDQISLLAYNYVGKQLDAWGQKRRYFLQPLIGIHFHSNLQGEMEPPGNVTYIYVYSVIGLLVLLIGCMNFINLSNARSVYRAKEVGLRKVIGAGRFQLIRQFLGESLIITIVALSFSFLSCEMLLPLFNETAGTTLSISGIVQPFVLLTLVGLIILVGIVAGGYPAIVLTSFKPVAVLKGPSYAGIKGSFVIKTMVVFQFTISIFLTIGTVTAYQQLRFMKGKTLGFDKEQKIVIPFRYNDKFSKNYIAMKSEFLSHHAIVGATASSSVPGRRTDVRYLSLTESRKDPAKNLNFIACDYDFISEYNIEIAEGRLLQKEKNDAKNSILINKSAVAFLGYSTAEEAIGKRWHLGWYDGKQVFREIVGITEDFHYQGMQNKVEPLFMVYDPYDFSALTLSLRTDYLKDTLDFIKKKWHEFYPFLPYEGFFLDEEFDRQYRAEEQIGKLLGIISGMGLVIACLGLLGLAAFMARQRTKEIGIRKVLGASVSRIALLFSKAFIKWILLANIFAWPAAFYAMNKWLENFAYRINTGPWIFIMAAALALIVALLAVSYQVLKAALANPVDSLRYE
jgi:putative ABC transport system permease protein